MKNILLLSSLLAWGCGGPSGPDPLQPVPAGRWVSEPTPFVGASATAQLVLDVDSGRVTFRDTAQCAFGLVDPPFEMDESGLFEARGTVNRAFLPSLRVRLRGQVVGARMTLDVQDEDGGPVLVFGTTVVLHLGGSVFTPRVIC